MYLYAKNLGSPNKMAKLQIAAANNWGAVDISFKKLIKADAVEVISSVWSTSAPNIGSASDAISNTI